MLRLYRMDSSEAGTENKAREHLYHTGYSDSVGNCCKGPEEVGLDKDTADKKLRTGCLDLGWRWGWGWD